MFSRVWQCLTAAAVFLAVLVLSASAFAAPPPNDNFASAEVLSGTPVSASGNTVDATKESGEPDHAGNAGGHSVWYQWTAPAGGSVTIETCGSGFDTLLAVYTGSSVNALTEVASNDDAFGACGTKSRVTFTAGSGEVYRIAVDGWAGATGSVALNVQQGTSAPANDNFVDAVVPFSLPVTGSNVGATKESGEPAHAGNAGGHSVWYRYTAPVSATVTVDACASDFDTLLGVYTGLAVNALSEVASNDNTGACGSGVQSKVTFSATAGTTYYAAVDGANGATGNIMLNLTTPPQCSDGVDNDGDGLTDFPADPGCTSPSDGDETNPTGGGPTGGGPIGGGPSGGGPIGGGGAAPPRDVTAAVISGVRSVPARWRRGTLLPRFSAAPVGTTVMFRLDEPATVTLTFERALAGRRVGRRCVAPTRANRTRPRCTRYVRAGTLVRRGAHAGLNRLRFQGRLTSRKLLPVGRYRLRLGATDAAGNRSVPRTTSFTILAGAPRGPTRRPPTPAQPNRDPAFPSPLASNASTQLEYDGVGRLSGAVTTITITTPATDADGDPLTYTWTASNGVITGNGLSASWRREIRLGDIASGDAVVRVSDGRGGSDMFTFSFR